MDDEELRLTEIREHDRAMWEQKIQKGIAARCNGLNFTLIETYRRTDTEEEKQQYLFTWELFAPSDYPPPKTFDIPKEIDGKRVTSICSSAFYSVVRDISNALYDKQEYEFRETYSEVLSARKPVWDIPTFRVNIPATVTRFEDKVPDHLLCEYITVTIDPENPNFRMIDGSLCTKDGKKLLHGLLKLSPNYGPQYIKEHCRFGIASIPEGVEEVPLDVFNSPYQILLAELIIPTSVKKMDLRVTSLGTHGAAYSFYYMGTKEQWEKVDFHLEKNDWDKINYHVYFYDPASTETGSWHFAEDGVTPKGIAPQEADSESETGFLAKAKNVWDTLKSIKFVKKK